MKGGTDGSAYGSPIRVLAKLLVRREVSSHRLAPCPIAGCLGANASISRGLPTTFHKPASTACNRCRTLWAGYLKSVIAFISI